MKVKDLKKYYIYHDADLLQVNNEHTGSLDEYDEEPVVDFDVAYIVDPNQKFDMYDEIKYLKMLKIWTTESAREASLIYL